MEPSPRKRIRAARWTLVTLLAIACGPREEIWIPVLRLAGGAEPGSEPAPLATIDRDTRPVLRDWPELRIYDERSFPLPPDGRLPLRIDPRRAWRARGAPATASAFVTARPLPASPAIEVVTVEIPAGSSPRPLPRDPGGRLGPGPGGVPRARLRAAGCLRDGLRGDAGSRGAPARAMAGRRISQPVGLVDLAPTLLELLGVPPLPEATGRSFASLLRNAQPPRDSDARPIFSETWFEAGFGAEGPKPVPQPSYAVRVGSRKLVRLRDGKGFRCAYDDLAADPSGQRDLYAANPEAAADLRALGYLE